MKIIILTMLTLISIHSIHAETFTANTPPWRGEWIWAPRNQEAPTLTVDLRSWLQAKPGGWGQSIINRILGNAAICGISNVEWQLNDQYGNALFPYHEREKVLKWPNWGVDFSAFDFPAAAAKFAKRCDMKITFIADQQFIEAAGKRYPQLTIQITGNKNGKTITAQKLKPENEARKWLSHHPYEFKRTFTLDHDVTKARLCLTADAIYDLTIDDKQIGTDGDWWRGETYDVTSLLTKGTHTITVKITPSETYAGLLFNLEWQDNTGPIQRLNSDSSWQCRASGTQKWHPVSIVGYEGTGPRFRIKDPWMNHRPLICEQETLECKVALSEMIASSTSNATSVTKTVDGSTTTYWAAKGVGTELEIMLKQPTLVTEIRLHSGNPAFDGLPSGPCSLKAYRVQYLDGETWRNLVEPVSDLAADGAKTVSSHAFTPKTISRLKLIIDKSHDTLQRNSGPVTEERMSTIIREIELIKAE